jgi:hypothetical protein
MNQGVAPGINTGTPRGRNGSGINTSGSPSNRQGPENGRPMREPVLKDSMTYGSSITCHQVGCSSGVDVAEKSSINAFFSQMTHLYNMSTAAGDNAAQYWADIAVNSNHPLAPLANVPGVFAALWTPEVAPTTAITLATAGYGFAALPKNLVHFTTAAGARGIAASATINSTRFGLFGPGAYLTAVGRPLNLFVRAAARVPINIATPAGTTRIIPYLVYVRWGLSPIVLP